MTIYLTLPTLAPGEQPPDESPCCRAPVVRRTDRHDVIYKCGAGYYGNWYEADGVAPVFSDTWYAGACETPSPAAVLRALLASLTREQLKKVAMTADDYSTIEVEECIYAAADALEEA